MADRQESRAPKSLPPDSEPTTRSKNRASSAARKNLALGQTNLGKAAPPAVAGAQVPPTRRRTADTPETAFRQNLARSAGAGSAENALVITGQPEEGGHVISAIRASPTGHPIAKAPSTTDAASGVQHSSAQAAQGSTNVFAPATPTAKAKTTTVPIPTPTAKPTTPKATATKATAKTTATAKATTDSKAIATTAARAPGAPAPAPAIPKAFATPPPVGASVAQAVSTGVRNPAKPSPASPAQPEVPTGVQNPAQPPLASALDAQ
jgi:hypothetical protein